MPTKGAPPQAQPAPTKPQPAAAAKPPTPHAQSPRAQQHAVPPPRPGATMVRQAARPGSAPAPGAQPAAQQGGEPIGADDRELKQLPEEIRKRFEDPSLRRPIAMPDVPAPTDEQWQAFLERRGHAPG